MSTENCENIGDGILKRGLIPSLEFFLDQSANQRLEIMNMHEAQQWSKLDNVTRILQWMESEDKLTMDYFARGYLS